MPRQGQSSQTAPPRTRASRPSPQPPFSPEVSSREANTSSADFSSDWQSALPAEEQEAWDDWEAETPATVAPSSPQDKGVKSPRQETRPAIERTTSPTLQNFEVSQQAEGVSQEGSVYSYRYRKAEESPAQNPPKTESATETPETQPMSPDSDLSPRPKRPRRRQSDEVYDANYRVILPPYRPPAASTEDEEEDWV